MFTDDDPAAILMAHLAPVGWVELATKGDIAEVRGEIAELRGDMQAMLPKLIAAKHRVVDRDCWSCPRRGVPRLSVPVTRHS